MVAPNHSIQWWWCPRKSLKVCDGSKKWAKVKQSTVKLWTRLNFAVVKALLSSPFIIINHFVSLWNGICCDYALFRSLFMSQNHRWPSHLKFVKTIEKPSLSMVNLRKNIQWWWSSGSKTIEKPSKAMVPQKKIITIPSSWKNYHRWSLVLHLSGCQWVGEGGTHVYYPYIVTFGRVDVPAPEIVTVTCGKKIL